MPYRSTKLTQMRWYGIVSEPAKTNISRMLTTAKNTQTAPR
jgi:hypothetical protein